MDAGRVAPPASLVPGARPGAGRGSAAAHGRRGRRGRRAPLRCAAPGTASLRPPPGAGRRAGDNSGRQHACSRPRPPRPAALNPCAAARRCARRRGTRSRRCTGGRALPRGIQPSTHATHTSCSAAGLRPPAGLRGQSPSGEAGRAQGPPSGQGTPTGSTGLAAPVHRTGGGWGVVSGGTTSPSGPRAAPPQCAGAAQAPPGRPKMAARWSSENVVVEFRDAQVGGPGGRRITEPGGQPPAGP